MTIKFKRLKTLILATATATAAASVLPSAFAQGFDAVRLNGAASGKDSGSAGAAVFSTPAYLGADKRRTLLLPVLDYQWANGWFAGVSNGIGVNFSDSPQMQYGLRLTVDAGRKESRANALRGMGDVAAAAEGGAFFNYAPLQGLVLTSSLRYGAGAQHKGLLVDLGAGYSSELAKNWRLGGGAGITFANAPYMQSFFGVSAAQAATSGYAVYTAGSGARDARAKLALTYSIDQRTSLTTVLSASRLLSEAKDSPLTRKRTSGSGVVAINYAF